MANQKRTEEYLQVADVWTVLDLIVAEFESDPTSVQCFDGRLVRRAIELSRRHKASPACARCGASEMEHGVFGIASHRFRPVRESPL